MDVMGTAHTVTRSQRSAVVLPPLVLVGRQLRLSIYEREPVAHKVVRVLSLSLFLSLRSCQLCPQTSGPPLLRIGTALQRGRNVYEPKRRIFTTPVFPPPDNDKPHCPKRKVVWAEQRSWYLELLPRTGVCRSMNLRAMPHTGPVPRSQPARPLFVWDTRYSATVLLLSVPDPTPYL